jgi:hypothetical protein
MRKRETPLTFTDRLGSAALGLFSGMAAGFVVWMVWLKTHETAPALAAFVFGGAGAGALLGFLALDLGFGFAAAVLGTLVGFVGAGALDQGRWIGGGATPSFQDDDTPTWRRALKWLFVAAGAAVFVVLIWR